MADDGENQAKMQAPDPPKLPDGFAVLQLRII
jgi:hypothetical protein